MDMDTKLSADMDAADIKARYDYACKALLAERYGVRQDGLRQD